jgi:hypothetical protein
MPKGLGREEAQDLMMPQQTKLLVQQARGELDLFFTLKKWSIQQINRVMYMFWYDDAEIMAMNETIKQRRERASDDDDDPINAESFRQTFEEKTWEQFRRVLFSDLMDPITRLGAMSPFTKLPTISDFFDERTPKFFLKNFYQWGFGTITGLPNSGKTNYACTMMEMAVEEKFKVATNVKINDSPEGIFYTTSFKTLLYECVCNQIKHHKTLIFLDEMPQFFTRKRATSGSYLTFEKVLFLLRKMGGNLIGIIQRASDIPSVVKEFSESYYQKINQKTLLFQRDRSPGSGELHIIGNIPETTLDYDTNDIASFTVDLDLNRLHDYISHIEESANQLEAIRDYIANVIDGGPDERANREIIAIKYLKTDCGLTQPQIAEVTGMAQGSVSRKLKEAKDPRNTIVGVP